MKHPLTSTLAFALCAGISTSSASVTIDWVTVGNPGNLTQSVANQAHGYSGGDSYGSVDYTYQIGRYLVTNSQYAAFLSVAAVSDPYGLYSINMGTSTHGGIIRNGISGNFTYTVIAGMENKPVNFISWFDAARFTNWLHNGQGGGSTETGAYTLNGSSSGIFIKNVDAKVWIPNEEEWFKAAYYNGNTGLYSLFPTGADVISVAHANYASSVGTVTDVGAYGIPSHYGTYDQGGNLWEWYDALTPSSVPGLRGGSWFDLMFSLSWYGRDVFDPSDEDYYVGFRIASVPEPSALVLTLLFSAAVVTRRRR